MDPIMAAPILPEAPLPRPDGPITEEEVLDWTARLAETIEEDEADLLAFGAEARKGRVLHLDKAIGDVLERSADLLLQKEFRSQFSDLLFGKSRLIGRGFAPANGDDGSRFLRDWKLAGVVPTLWDNLRGRDRDASERRYALLSPFPLPILDVASGSTTDQADLIHRLLGLPATLMDLRPPAQIQGYEVAGWAQNVRAELHWILEHGEGWRPLNPRLTAEQWLYSLEQSVELMLDPTFRLEFSEILYGRTDGHDFFYGPEDAECRRHLRLKWAVYQTHYPEWIEDSRRYLVLAPFPIPWSRWAPRSRHRGNGGLSSRLELIHRDELTSHPHYILVCAKCGSPQGAFVPLDCLEDEIESPRIQVKHMMARYGAKPWKASQTLRRLAEHFSDEIVGFEASWVHPENVGPFQRSPLSGPVSHLLDYAMGLHKYDEFASITWMTSLKEHATRRTLLLLAGLLARLKCQACGSVGGILYWPRFAHWIDGDVDPTSQGKRVKRLADVLRASRVRVETDPLFSRVLIFPDQPPRQRFVDILRRAELRHEDSRPAGSSGQPNHWLLAIWVSEALPNWKVLLARLGLGRRQGNLDPETSTLHEQFANLRQRLSSVRTRTDSLWSTVREAQRLLMAPEFGGAAGLLNEHFAVEKLKDDLAQYRFRARTSERFKGIEPA